MIIEQYNIKLKRLTIDDIELVRNWRNNWKIRKTMAYKSYITKSMQLKWFNSINNKNNYYFIIEHNDNKIGLINSKNVDINNMCGEGGIFIWDENIEHPYIPIFASLCLLNTVFYTIGIFNKSFIQVLSSNYRAIKYNQSLGYILVPGQQKVKNQYYILTKEDYEKKAIKFNKIAQKLTNDYEMPRINGQISDKNLDKINEVLILANKNEF